jgi:glycosyltransferase involved in cell wall biosynthesis
VQIRMAEILFWCAFILVFYAYLGYPLFLWGLCRFRNRAVQKGNISPAVSFIITARNEEKRIREKIENTLNQDYPRDKLEIIVASDCSTDRTDDIVDSYRQRGVILVRASEKKGKENAQKYAVDKASGEVLVFSDVATALRSDGVSNIVRNFNDRSVGCVSSVDRFIDADGNLSGEGAYVRYEMLLRNLETRVNTLVGLSGSFFAARREMCANWATDRQSDFNTLLNSVQLGLRGVSDSDSIGYYKNIVDEQKEFERKVRTVLRGISVFMESLPLLNPFKFGLFSWQLFSHKLCRWLVPFALILSLVSNALLLRKSSFYLFTMFSQVLVYGIALGGMTSEHLLKKKAVKLLHYFVLVNLSILQAWYRYVRGERVLAWEPSQR